MIRLAANIFVKKKHHHLELFDEQDLESIHWLAIQMLLSVSGVASLSFALINVELADIWLTIGIMGLIFCVCWASLILRRVLILRRESVALARHVNLSRFNRNTSADKDILEGVSAWLANALTPRLITGMRTWAARATGAVGSKVPPW